VERTGTHRESGNAGLLDASGEKTQDVHGARARGTGEGSGWSGDEVNLVSSSRNSFGRR